MNVTQMRARVAKCYPGPRWANKVQRMNDDQVIAIFYRLSKKGMIK